MKSMMRKKRAFGLFLFAALAWTNACAETTISDLKVTPIEPLGLAIDYNVSGAVTQYLLQVSTTVAGTTYVATNVVGATNCVDGAHRVYWNMAADGLTIDATEASVEVSYDFREGARYCVIDLSNGAEDGVTYPVTYLDAEPSGGFNTDVYKTTNLVLKCVDAGSFIMGDDQTNEAHRVTLTKPFYMGIFEVTQKQWELVMGSNPSWFTTDGTMKPVENVSYDMIRGSVKGANWPASDEVDGEAEGDTEDSFLGRLRKRTGIKFDLPTEAQWEYTCRARTTTAYSYGDSANGDYMWYFDNSSSTSHEVGMRESNDWGFYDMHGNVSEFCLDWRGTLSYGTDPKGPSSGDRQRVDRGGHWSNYASYCTSFRRYYGNPSYTFSSNGFRLSRTLP